MILYNGKEKKCLDHNRPGKIRIENDQKAPNSICICPDT